MEKERYTIESFEIDEPSCIFDNKTQQGILSLVEYNYDETVNLKNLLNQQDAKIKELEKARQREVIIHQNYRQGYIKDLQEINELQEEKQQLNEHIKELELLLKADKKIETNSLNGFEKLRQENKQLKQSQKQLAISELENLRLLIMRQTYICGGLATKNEIVEANAYNRCLADIRDILDNQIKSLKGEEK